MDELRDAALAYARSGLSVFPLPPDSKQPPRIQWTPNQTKAWGEREINEWWAEHPNDNIAIATGRLSGVSVLDVDGKKGLASLKEAKVSPPETYTVETPNAGWHLYYTYNSQLKQTQGILDHIDIRNDGGYVVAPPSTLDGKPYTVRRNGSYTEWADVPEALWPRRDSASTGSLTQDQPLWVAEALISGVPQPGRNQMATRLAGYFRSMNLPQDVALAALKQFADACNPPLGYDELQTTLASVWRYERTAPATYQGAPLPTPIVDISIGNRRIYRWPDSGLMVKLDKLFQTRRGIDCWLTVATSDLGTIYGPIHFDLLSGTKRTELRRELKERKEHDWASVLQHVASLTIESLVDSSDVVDMATYHRKADTPWLMRPFVKRHQPSVLMGDGGEGKSTLAIALMISLASGTSLIPGLTVQEPCNTMMVDWETDEDEFAMVRDALLSAANLPMPERSLLYKHVGTGSLQDQLDSIQRTCTEHDLGFLLVDSIVASAGGDVNEAEAARLYFNTIGALGIATLGIAHISKEGSESKRRRTRPFGSVFYWNLARNIWEIRKDQDAGSPTSSLGLYHAKINRGRESKPIGLEVAFTEDADGNITQINYTSADVADSPVLAEKLTNADRIRSAIRGLPGMKGDPATIAESAGLEVDVVRATLNTKRYKGVIWLKIAGTTEWGLLAPDTKQNALRNGTRYVTERREPPKGVSPLHSANYEEEKEEGVTENESW